MSFEQLLKLGAQGRVVPARAIQEGGALSGCRLLHRQIEEDLFEVGIVFVHRLATGHAGLLCSVRCLPVKTRSGFEKLRLPYASRLITPLKRCRLRVSMQQE